MVFICPSACEEVYVIVSGCPCSASIGMRTGTGEMHWGHALSQAGRVGTGMEQPRKLMVAAGAASAFLGSAVAALGSETSLQFQVR